MLFSSRLVVTSLLVATVSARRQPGHSNCTASVEALAAREYFYVGGNYVNTTTGHLFANQMYVEKLIPKKSTQPYPLVFIHGQAQTGTNWLIKPDGGAGWATYFLNKGYVVYIVDQTERGRSAWDPAGGTTQSTYTAEIIEQRFTAIKDFMLWPQAALHTQWPGTGVMGDPIFDQYYASNIQFQANTISQETKMQTAGVALLTKIGPSVLISHSQGGLLPWVIADAAPSLVKAIVSIEPTGPPFIDGVFSTGRTRIYGVTNIPLTYHPAPTNTTAPLNTQVVPNNGTGVGTCIIQAEPARQLTSFKNIPVLLETAEASYHAVYDDCTANFLKQAGVPVEHLKLGEAGIHGNGHLHFMEKNSDEIAALIDSWIRKKV